MRERTSLVTEYCFQCLGLLARCVRGPDAGTAAKCPFERKSGNERHPLKINLKSLPVSQRFLFISNNSHVSHLNGFLILKISVLWESIQIKRVIFEQFCCVASVLSEMDFFMNPKSSKSHCYIDKGELFARMK